MTVTMLHYDILLSLIPYLPPITMIEYATTCHQLCQPALRQLWNSPKITTPKSFQSFMQSLLNSILILPNPNNLPRFNYHRWIKQLTISFPTFQHISIHLLPLLLFNKLSNLTHVSLYNTYAIFSSNIQSLHLNRCIIKNMPIHIDANSDHLHHQQEEELNILTNIQSILNQNISIIESSSSSFILSAIYKSYLEDSSSSSIRLPLTHLSILNCTINIEPNHSINDNIETATIQLSDDHLSIIAHSCPKLIQCQMNGFFSDAGIIHLANHCHQLEEVYFTLPTNLVQSNTITQQAIYELAIHCTKLRHFSCLGQTRNQSNPCKRNFSLTLSFYY